MPGTKENVRFWDEVDVFVSSDLTATLPALEADPLPATFVRAGLITPEGLNQAREEEVNDHYAFGRDALVGQTRKNFKESWSAQFMEDNAVTHRLVYPGSTTTNIVVPKVEDLNIVFVLRNTGTGHVERWRTAGHARVGVNGERARTDAAPSTVPMMFTIFAADANAEGEQALYDRQVIEGSGAGGTVVPFGDPEPPTGG